MEPVEWFSPEFIRQMNLCTMVSEEVLLSSFQSILFAVALRTETTPSDVGETLTKIIPDELWDQLKLELMFAMDDADVAP